MGCYAESGQPDVPVEIDQHVRRRNVFMDQAVPMDLAECRRQANGDAQEMRQLKQLLVSRSRTRSRGSPPGSLSPTIVRS